MITQMEKKIRCKEGEFLYRWQADVGDHQRCWTPRGSVSGGELLKKQAASES